METSQCPECGEAIGGSNHTLLPTNARSTEMEHIAEQVGNERNPEPWPHPQF